MRRAADPCALAALGLLVLARALLRLGPGRVLRWASRPARLHSSVSTPCAAERLARLAACLAALAGRPGLSSTCLEQAIALRLAAAAVRSDARVVIGVRSSGVDLQAHAWVELGGSVLIGGAAAEGMHRLRPAAAGHVARS